MSFTYFLTLIGLIEVVRIFDYSGSVYLLTSFLMRLSKNDIFELLKEEFSVDVLECDIIAYDLMNISIKGKFSLSRVCELFEDLLLQEDAPDEAIVRMVDKAGILFRVLIFPNRDVITSDNTVNNSNKKRRFSEQVQFNYTINRECEF